MTGAFCPICYEVVDVSSHNLESVAGCGHVFHESCLQKWVAHSPVSPKCPLCKASCGPRERQRLYFQTSAECSQPLESEKNFTGCSEADAKHVRNLQEKIVVLKKSLQLARQQCAEAQAAVEENKREVQNISEFARLTSQDLFVAVERLERAEQELDGSRKEKNRMMKEMAKLGREIAATKLIENVDLSEGEVLNLTSGGGSRPQTKDDYIQILAKALVMRNRAFKTLMTTCNEHCLEKDAVKRESTKLRSKVEQLQSRLKEVINAQERTGNATLRSLNKVETSGEVRSERQQTLAKLSVNRTKKAEDTGISLRFSALQDTDRDELNTVRLSERNSRRETCVGREAVSADTPANHTSVLLPSASANCAVVISHTRLTSPGFTSGSDHARPSGIVSREEANNPVDLKFLPIPIRRARKTSLVEDGFYAKDSDVSWKETAQKLLGSKKTYGFNLSGPNGPCSRALVKPPPPFIVPPQRGSNSGRQGKKPKLTVPQDSKIDHFFGRH
ncbi:hypothetical protein R1sor_024920 [Riccia sorocarpa]|uniref:RING-type domain-containing protein n=1 Tax=Riccia sorocarpa TaxID=122646 RepID=A0ABD3GXX2_9MARC